MERVTDKQLEGVVALINKATNSPMQPWVDGKAQIGCYHLSHAYGGVCLHRMYNEGGGVTSVLTYGHVPKRELMGLMRAFLEGIAVLA